MLNDATLRNTPRAVEDAILESNHPIEMRQRMIEAMERTGVIVPHTRDQEFDPRLANPQVSAVSSLPVRPTQEATCFRVIYPGGNNRFEIYDVSEAGLDAQERQLRAMYGSR